MTETEQKPEVKKQFFVTHVGHITVSNYGVVEFETGGAPAVGIMPRRVIWHIDTLREINREVRQAVAEMRKEGVYAR